MYSTVYTQQYFLFLIRDLLVMEYFSVQFWYSYFSEGSELNIHNNHFAQICDRFEVKLEGLGPTLHQKNLLFVWLKDPPVITAQSSGLFWPGWWLVDLWFCTDGWREPCRCRSWRNQVWSGWINSSSQLPTRLGGISSPRLTPSFICHNYSFYPQIQQPSPFRLINPRQ